MFTLSLGDRRERHGQRFGGRADRVAALAQDREFDGFPDEVVDAPERGVGQPAQVQPVVASQAQALPQCGHEEVAVVTGCFAAECSEGAAGLALPVRLAPPVLARVVGFPHHIPHQIVQPVPPGRGGVGVNEWPLNQVEGGRVVVEAGRGGGQFDREGIQQADGTQYAAYVRGEVTERTRDKGGEVEVELAGGRGAVVAAVEVEEPHDRQVQVERRTVGVRGDQVAGAVVHQRSPGDGQPLAQVDLAVLRREVADRVLTRFLGGAADQQRPALRGGPVELAFEFGVVPLEPVGAGDDEEGVRHEPHHALDQPLQIAVYAVADILEGVQQNNEVSRFLSCTRLRYQASRWE
ncbi:hypothetical protein [Streptomyces sp. 061-3]|uniref:hypothetical protein n=1 Tax=Streptomyces sp. 061-3 TaxID=2789268 RepID=UPI0039810F98